MKWKWGDLLFKVEQSIKNVYSQNKNVGRIFILVLIMFSTLGQ